MKTKATRVLSLVVMMLSCQVVSGGVSVEPSAAQSGTYGLRAEVRRGCEGETSILVLGPVVTEQRVEACKEVVVGGEVADGGELEAIAGERVAFSSGFRVASGGRLVAGVDGAWDPGFVVDESSASATELSIRWSARFDEVVLAPGDGFVTLRIEREGIGRGWVHYEAAETGGWVWVEIEEDTGERRTSSRAQISPGWHRLEVRWDVGSAIEPTGRAALILDGSPAGELAELDLRTALVDSVSVGAVRAPADGGWVEIDDYETWTVE